jgi:hypothetical protein
MSPVVVLAVSVISSETDVLLRLGLLTLLLAVAGKAVFDALRLRKTFYLRFGRSL